MRCRARHRHARPGTAGRRGTRARHQRLRRRGSRRESASVANPVDTIAAVSAENYGKALRAVLDDERVDSVIAIYIPLQAADGPAYARTIVEAASAQSTEI